MFVFVVRPILVGHCVDIVTGNLASPMFKIYKIEIFMKNYFSVTEVCTVKV